MSGFESEIFKILTSETFSSLLNREAVKITELNAIIALLIEFNIPFNLTYFHQTNAAIPRVSLYISISPKIKIEFCFYFH